MQELKEKIDKVNDEVILECEQDSNLIKQKSGFLSSFINRIDTKNRKKFVIGLITVSILIVFLTILLLCIEFSKTTIDLNKYYTVNIIGVDGYAKASIKNTKNADDILLDKFTKVSESNFLNSIEYLSFFDNINFVFNKNENIKNGDKIKATAIYDKELAKKYKLKIKNPILSLKVENLNKAKIIDAFDGLEVSFSGISPMGNVKLTNNNTDTFIRTLTYKASKDNSLKNGDAITVSVIFDEDKALGSGIVLEEKTKEYIVKGLDEYITDETVVTDEIKKKVLKEFNDKIESILAKEWERIYNTFGEYCYNPKKVSISTPKLISSTLLSAKMQNKLIDNRINNVVVIYKVTINAKADSFFGSSTGGERIGYIGLQFGNISTSNDKVTIGSDSVASGYIYKNYISSKIIDDIENNLIHGNKDRYIISNF